MRGKRWMPWVRRVAQAADSDLVQACSYGALTLALDLWLLSRFRGDLRGVAAALGALVAVGGLVGLGLGLAIGRWNAHHRRAAASVPRPGVRLVRCVLTGTLYIHLALPVAVLVDIVLHPDHLVGYLGGTLDRV
ncbi:hypothetical protein AB0D10_31040 [Kitasatospora sp. NPDC048545]|uniref:hypothetical protein n=1 Tax=Kitasatospora sp. NPDC048545 TaxID=3157208 RepID=UPI0033CD9BCC